MVGSDVFTVSKHLSVLKNAGLVLNEKRGTIISYRLRCPCVLNFIDSSRRSSRQTLKSR
ncbi:MAG TPA: hypothetical protein PLM53_16630 [Spirochaetota bacterium]|nr:hypothetical protein [Spirochaetota bacterium]HQH98723.1 hypothetical protein [Spirochaetota bacterium]